MINFYNQVPSIYNNASRDFQYLSWLINIVLNSVKHNVDDLYNLPSTKADPRLTELLAMTLGFRVKRNYNQKQLTALVSIIPSILKYKGSVEAVNLAGKALIKASGAEGIFKSELEDNCLKIQIPETLVDTILFMDLLPYILPAGITTQVITKTDYKAKDIDDIEVGYHDKLYATWKTDLAWDKDAQAPVGLATLFKDSSFYDAENNPNKPEFANFKRPISVDEEGKPILNVNAGLLDNSIIPVLESTLKDEKIQQLMETTTQKDEE